MDLKVFIGHLATVFTIAVFLAGFEICYKIWTKKSTVDIPAIPFICGLVSCSFWLRYGVLIADSALFVVNGTGLCLQIIYLFWYAFYNTKGTYYKQLFCAIFLITFLFLYTSYCVDSTEEAQRIAGIAACSAGVIFMASPLSSLAHVLKTKSVEALPFSMVLCTFIMATLWVFYGVLAHDKFVQVPNGLGALLALAQLSLFAIFPKKKQYLLLTTGV